MTTTTRRTARAAVAVAAAALIGGLALVPDAGAAPAATPAAAAAPSDAAAATRVLDGADLVAHWYEDFLGRTLYAARADQGRLYWARQLDAGASQQEVLGGIVRSREFADVAVREVYVRLLGRLPDPGARYWVDGVQRGTAVEWVEQNVLASDEYVVDGSTEAWVERRLYPDVLGRQGSSAEGAYWASRYDELGPLGVVRAIWYSSEGVDRRVAGHYRDLLGRDPRAGEVGYWRDAEARSDLATRIAFATTAEYATLDPEEDLSPADDALAVEAYLDDVAAGRWPQAFERLSPDSQVAAGGYGAFFARREELSRTVAPFAATPVRDYLANLVTEGSSAIVVPRGGAEPTDALSFGVRFGFTGVAGRRIDTGVRPVSLRLGPDDRRLGVGSPLTLTVDRRGVQTRGGVIVDGRFQPTGSFDDPAAGARTTVVPDPVLAPGRHVVTAYAVTGTVLQVESSVFTVR